MIYLETQPIEIPVMKSHIHQLVEKGLYLKKFYNTYLLISSNKYLC